MKNRLQCLDICSRAGLAFVFAFAYFLVFFSITIVRLITLKKTRGWEDLFFFLCLLHLHILRPVSLFERRVLPGKTFGLKRQASGTQPVEQHWLWAPLIVAIDFLCDVHDRFPGTTWQWGPEGEGTKKGSFGELQVGVSCSNIVCGYSPRFTGAITRRGKYYLCLREPLKPRAAGGR